jgi:hypothetical protein
MQGLALAELLAVLAHAPITVSTGASRMSSKVVLAFLTFLCMNNVTVERHGAGRRLAGNYVCRLVGELCRHLCSSKVSGTVPVMYTMSSKVVFGMA